MFADLPFAEIILTAFLTAVFVRFFPQTVKLGLTFFFLPLLTVLFITKAVRKWRG